MPDGKYFSELIMENTEQKNKEKKKSYLWAGIAGGFTAVTCCIAPVVLILLGFGTAISMAVMHQFHLVSIVSGVILMILISLYLVKRKSGVCNISTMKKNWKNIAYAIIFLAVSWVILNYLVVAPVAGLVYGNIPVNQKPLGNIKEMAEIHGMPEMADIEVEPEYEGKKKLLLNIEGVFCGSCGPAIEYDLKSILGVLEVERLSNGVSLIYDSDVTSKDVIIAAVHDPYSAKILSEEKIK
mgnify:CR=1 FL=1